MGEYELLGGALEGRNCFPGQISKTLLFIVSKRGISGGFGGVLGNGG